MKHHHHSCPECGHEWHCYEEECAGIVEKLCEACMGADEEDV